MTSDERMAKSPMAGFSSLFAANATENQMEFPRLAPKISRRRLEAGYSSNCHAEKMLGFTRFLPAGVDAEKKFFSRHRIVGFAIIGPHTRSTAHQLINDPIGHRPLGDSFHRINHTLPKTSCPFLKIVNAWRNRRILPNTLSMNFPKCVLVKRGGRH